MLGAHDDFMKMKLNVESMEFRKLFTVYVVMALTFFIRKFVF